MGGNVGILLQRQESQPHQVCRTENLRAPLPATASEPWLQSGWTRAFRRSNLKPSFLHLLAQLESLMHSGASLWPGFGNLLAQMDQSRWGSGAI